MELTSNYDLTTLFITKKIKIFIDEDYSFSIQLKTIKEMLTDEDFIKSFHYWKIDIIEWNTKIFQNKEMIEPWEFIKEILFDLGASKEFSSIAKSMKATLYSLNNEVDFDYKKREVKIENVTITSEIWNYLIYLLKLSCGEKVTKPQTFTSPEAKKLFLKQEEAERKIRQIRAEKRQDEQDGLIKAFLSITYSFPSITFDYLFNQTLAQIYWLQEKAAGAVSYSLNEKIAASGNMKKGSKLEFFIK